MISEPRNRGFGNRDTLFQQSGPQLLERDVRLLANPSLELFLMPLQGVRLMPSELVGLVAVSDFSGFTSWACALASAAASAATDSLERCMGGLHGSGLRREHIEAHSP